jgi:hypothetical protein
MSISWWGILTRSISRPVSRSQRRQQKKCRVSPQLETLEARDVPTVIAHPDYVVKLNPNGVKPDQTTGPTGYTPSQIEAGYGFNQISDGTSANGAGTTIAIVDAYSDPNITSDLQNFDKEFGLPNPTFNVVNQTGGTSLPKGNTGWAGEISLDVEWAHAMAPGANILLVEATNASYANLFTAVRFAASQKGVVAVSMSWGGSEFSGETAYDTSTLTPPSSNPDVVFVTSSGDSGSPANYPSSSPNVLSVGGTSLTLSSSGAYESETVWDDTYGSSGGGISKYEAQPTYQKGVVTQSTTKRTTPDVAYDADPATGFPVYQTYGNSPSTPWLQYGGTSDASPQWAALIAIADQGRIVAGETALTNATLMPLLYQAPSTDFHDITTGHSGGTSKYAAGVGYDLATGLGTPIANALVSTLVGGSTAPSTAATHFSITPSSGNESDGNSFTITVTALTSTGATATTYTGTVGFSSSDAGDSLPGNFQFTTGDDGTATFTITLNTPGTDTVTVTDTSSSSINGSATYSVSAPFFTVTGIPSSVQAGNAETFTVEAFNADGTADTNYSGTVQFSSSDAHAQFSANDTTIASGMGSFTVTFETAGTQSVTATDTVNDMTGSETLISVTPGPLSQLIFSQQPTSASVNGAITPAVTVTEEDQFGNVLTNDNTGLITLSLTTSNGATLTGGSVTVSHGVATFSSLSVNEAGTYTLTANEGSLSAISSSFTVSTVTSNVIENFQNGLNNYFYVGNARPVVGTSTAAAHPGTATDGLYDDQDGNWYFREDSGAVIKPGDTVSVWVNFEGGANGRAYFGFGTTASGLDSVVLAPNTGQFIIQSNAGFDTYTNLAADTQSYTANSWYLVQVEWGTSGKVVANLYSSNGTTLLNSISVATGDTTPGWFAFRAIGSSGTATYYSTVTDTPGANNFVVPVSNSGSNQHGRSDSHTKVSILPLTSGVLLSSGSHGRGETAAEKLWFALHEEFGEPGFFE